MEKNIDEDILESRRVDTNSDIPIREQVLRIAVYDEFRAYESYSQIIDKFGQIHIFLNIKEAESRHYSALIHLLEKYDIEVPINNWASKIEAPNTLIESYELGVAAEIDNINMYNDLLKYTQEDDIKEVLFRLQAASFNNHLPAFRNAVQNYYNQSQGGFNQKNIMENIGEYQKIVEDVMNGNINENSISDIFSKLNSSMIGGAIVGSSAVAILNNIVEKNKE